MTLQTARPGPKINLARVWPLGLKKAHGTCPTIFPNDYAPHACVPLRTAA
jgi:hypothetical protein